MQNRSVGAGSDDGVVADLVAFFDGRVALNAALQQKASQTPVEALPHHAENARNVLHA